MLLFLATRWHFSQTPGTFSLSRSPSNERLGNPIGQKTRAGALDLRFETGRDPLGCSQWDYPEVIALVVAFEAIQRLIAPQHVTGVLVLTIDLVGIVINVVATWVLAKASRTSLNIRGAYARILTDL